MVDKNSRSKPKDHSRNNSQSGTSNNKRLNFIKQHSNFIKQHSNLLQSKLIKIPGHNLNTSKTSMQPATSPSLQLLRAHRQQNNVSSNNSQVLNLQGCTQISQEPAGVRFDINFTTNDVRAVPPPLSPVPPPLSQGRANNLESQIGFQQFFGRQETIQSHKQKSATRELTPLNTFQSRNRFEPIATQKSTTRRTQQLYMLDRERSQRIGWNAYQGSSEHHNESIQTVQMNPALFGIHNKNSRYGTVKIFHEAKDVIGEIKLDEGEFFTVAHAPLLQLRRPVNQAVKIQSQDVSIDLDEDSELLGSEDHRNISHIRSGSWTEELLQDRSHLDLEKMVGNIQNPSKLNKKR